ncbi:MAG TPA: cytosine permease [Myxococcota bacterium]|nr:cytosine permease [Myxococcota bacterium]
MTSLKAALSTPMKIRLREEALFGRLPLLADERILSTGSTLAAGLNAAVAAWCFLIGGYTANVTGAVPGVVALLCGCTVGVVLSAALSMACNRYGLDPTDASKPCFGQRGAKLVLLVYVLNQVGWSGLTLVMFGRGLRSVLGAIGPGQGESMVSLMVLMGLTSVYVFVARSARGVTVLNQVAMPGLMVVAGIVVYVVFRDATWTDVVRIPPLIGGPDARVNAVTAFEYALGAGLSWAPALGFLTRHTDSQRNSVYPQALTMGLGVGLMASLGLLAALLFRNYDPTLWLVFLGGRAFGALTLLLVASTNLAATASTMFSAGLALKHLRGLRRLSWPVLVALPFVPLVGFVGAPSYLYEHGGTFLATNASLLGPITGVFAVDYLWLRRQRVNLSQVFEDDRGGHYWFLRGFNLASLGAVAVGQLVALWLFNPLTHAVHSPVRLMGSTGPGILVAMAFYALLARFWLIPAGLGGYNANATPVPLKRANL